MAVCAIEAIFGLPFSRPFSFLLQGLGFYDVSSFASAVRLIALILGLVVMIFAHNKSFIHYGLCPEDQRKARQNKLVSASIGFLLFIASILTLRTVFTSSGNPSSAEILATLIPVFSILLCFHFLLKQPLRFIKEKKGKLWLQGCKEAFLSQLTPF